MNLFNKTLKSFKTEFIGEDVILNPAKDSIYYGRMSDKEIEEMQARNQLAIQKRIEELGNRWILHPDNKVTRITKW